MVRIRYSVNESGTVLTSKPVSSSLGSFRSKISRTDSGWVVVILKHSDAEGDDTWVQVEDTEANTKNLSVAKAKAKRGLKSLGVHFLDEVRRRTSE